LRAVGLRGAAFAVAVLAAVLPGAFRAAGRFAATFFGAPAACFAAFGAAGSAAVVAGLARGFAAPVAFAVFAFAPRFAGAVPPPRSIFSARIASASSSVSESTLSRSGRVALSLPCLT
jgi:hypothetical protein